MTASNGDAQRLGAVIRKRRETMAPPLTQGELADEIRMDIKTIGNIERGVSPRMRPATKYVIERALRWEHGSIDKVLAGGDPTELAPQPALRSEEGDLFYVLGNARAGSPEALQTIRLILENDLERRRSGG